MTGRIYENLSSTVDGQGWSRWVIPNPKTYKLSCCDCGLVHEFQFRSRSKQIEYRVRRDNRSTGQMRRYRKK